MELGELRQRMDKQDLLLKEIRDILVSHIAVESGMKPALDELVSLWQGSKVISRIIAWVILIAGSVGGALLWAKEHIK